MTQPSPKFIASARHRAGLSQTAAAALVYKNLRTWQQWEMLDTASRSARAMDTALFELFCLKARITCGRCGRAVGPDWLPGEACPGCGEGL